MVLAKQFYDSECRHSIYRSIENLEHAIVEGLVEGKKMHEGYIYVFEDNSYIFINKGRNFLNWGA